MLKLTNLIGFGGGGEPPRIEWQYSVNQTLPNLSSYTWNGCTFGEESPDRILLVCTHAESSSDIWTTSVTIGGISATKVVEQKTQTDQGRVAIWAAKVPTGTSGTVVVNCSSTSGANGIDVFAMYGITNLTPVETGGANGHPMNFSENVKANDVAVAHVEATNGGSNIAWSGLTERNEHVTPTDGTYTRMSSAADVMTETKTLNVTATPSSTPLHRSGVIAVWRK